MRAPTSAWRSPPPLSRSRGAPCSIRRRPWRGWERLALGAGPLGGGRRRGWPTPDAAAMALPLWDPGRVRAAAARRSPDLLGPRADVAAIALSPHGQGGGRATWLVAPMPSLEALTRAQPPPGWTDVHRGGWARAGRPLAAVEADSGLVFAQLMTHDSAAWFGPGFREFAVAAPDSWPALRASGIALGRWWRRAALAWALQSPELARAETDGLLLLWRRDVVERLQRLAPFARFDAPDPLVADGGLWWGAYGYLESEAFPLVRRMEVRGHPLGYLHAAVA